MADEKIVTSIVANSDFSNLIADVQRVTASLSRLQQEFAGSNRSLAGQIDATNAMFSETMRKTGQFSTHFVSLTSDVEKFGRNLDSGRLKLRDYFRVYQDHTRTTGGLIRDLAKQQVQLQNAVLQPLGRNAQGLMQYNVHIPRGLDLTKNKTSILKQELQIMNKVIQDGGVQLINWGKNTQWAGRQLTVGLTLPLVAFGKAAADAFKVADQELTRLTKVYGDIAGTSAQELGQIRKEVSATAKELSAAMGVNFTETIGLAADIAATGKTGNELLSSVSETTRLAVLGEVDRQEAMKATLAIQSAFKQNTEELAETINFLNAVENQTSTTLNDLVTAIPKAGPVIKGLGGSVQDLALYLTAMREGGINATEGANALKSALASLINPTDVAVKRFQGFGIDLLGIVQKNAGSTTDTLFALQAALDNLNPLQKQQAIEQLFGKFQYSRLNALFENLGKQGSQTLQVLDLMKASAGELEAVAGRELAAVTESAAGRYKRAVETLKAELAGVGDQFLNIGTKLVNVLSKIIEFAQKLPDPIKKIMAFGGAFTAIIGPIIMLTGVLANFFGYIIKGLGHFKALFKGAEGFKLLTPEIMAAKAAGSQLANEFYSDALAADTLRIAIEKLNNDLVLLQKNALGISKPGSTTGQLISTIAGTPLMAVGGGARVTDPNHPLVGTQSRASAHLNPRDPNNPSSIFGLTLQPIPLNRKIGRTPQVMMTEALPNIEGVTSHQGYSTGVVAGEHARYAALMATLGVQSRQEIEALKKTIALGGQVSSEFIATFDDILPITQRLTQNAATQSASIVAQLRAGQLSAEQARAAIIAVNADLERMMGSEISLYAASRGRTIDLSKAPLINQPVVDASGKPNTRGMFRQGIFSDVMSAVGRATGTRTFGGPYSIETTTPSGLIIPRRNAGGPIFYNNGDQVPGPNINADVVPAMLTPGEFVIRRDVAQQDPNGMRALNEGRAMIIPTFNRGGKIPGIQYRNTGNGIHRSPIRLQRTHITDDLSGLALLLPDWVNQGINSRNNGLTGAAIASGIKQVLDEGNVSNRYRPNDLLVEATRTLGGDVGQAQRRSNVALQQLINTLESEEYRSRTIGGRSNPFGFERLARDIYRPALRGIRVDPSRTGGSTRNLFSALSQIFTNRAQGRMTEDEAISRGLTSGEKTGSRSLGQIVTRKDGRKAWVRAETTIGSSMPLWARRTNLSSLLTTARGMSSALSVIKRNRGGSVPGYVRGGGIVRSGRIAYGDNFDYRRTPFGMGFTGIPQAQGIQPISTPPKQIGMLAGSLISMGGFYGGSALGSRFGQTGSMVGGLLGSMLLPSLMGGMGGMRGQTDPAIYAEKLNKSMLANKAWAQSAAMSAQQGSKWGRILTGLIGGITKTNLIIGAGVVAVTAGYKAWQNYNETQRLSAAAFGMTADSAQKAGLKFTDYGKKIKDAIAAQKLLIDQNMMTYESLQSAGTPFKMTIEEYKKLRKELKETMAEQIKVINATSRPDAARVAVQLKEQLMAAGESAEEAAKKVYTLFNLSNKSGMSAGVLNTEAFKKITDAQSAAVSAVGSFNYAKAFENSRDAAAALNTALMAINNGIDDLVSKTEKAAKKKGQDFNETAARYEAEKKQLDSIASKVKNQEEIGKGVLDQLKKQNPEVEKFVTAQDTAVSVFQKLRLVARGFTGDLLDMNAQQVDAIYKLQIATAQAVETVNKEGLLAKEYEAYNKLKKQRDDLAKATKGQSVQEQIDIRERLKALDKEIKRINDKAEAKKKALREEAQAEDMALRIQQQQLEYEKAVASGDFGGAASAQLELKQLLNEQQVILTEQQIEERRLKDVRPLEREREKIQEAQEKLGDKAALAAESLDSVNKRLEKQKEKIDNVNTAMTSLQVALKLNANNIEEFKTTKEFKGLAADLVDAVREAGIVTPNTNLPDVRNGQLVDNIGQQALDLLSKYGSGIDTIVADQGLTVNATGDIVVNGKSVSTSTDTVGGKKTPHKITDPSPDRRYETKDGVLTDKARGEIVDTFKFSRNEYFEYQGKVYRVTGSKMTNTRAILQKADGGKVSGPGTGTSDSIPAYLSNGEYVIRASSVNKYGKEFFDGLNAQKFKEGGSIDKSNRNGAVYPYNKTSIIDATGSKLPIRKPGYKIEAPKREDFNNEKEYYDAIRKWQIDSTYVTTPEKEYGIDKITSPMGSLRRFMEIARSQIGAGHSYDLQSPVTKDRPLNANKYSIWANDIYKLGSDVLQWCGAFVAWVAANSGVKVSDKMFSAFQATKDYKKQGLFKDSAMKDLKMGDLVWFDSSSEEYNPKGVPDHAAIVSAVRKNEINAIGSFGIGSVDNYPFPKKNLFGSVRPNFTSFAKGGIVKGFKDGGAPHEMGMRNQVPAKKLNWFQRYVNNLTEVQDQAASMLGIGEALPVGSLLRKIAGQGRKGDTLSAALLPLNFTGLGLGSKIGAVGKGISSGASIAKVFAKQAYGNVLNRMPGTIGLRTKYHGGPSEIPSGGFTKQDLRGWNFPGTYLTDDPITAAQYGATASKNLGRYTPGSTYQFAVKPGEKVSILNLSKKASSDLKSNLINVINSTDGITDESKNLVINAIKNAKTMDEAILAARSVRFDVNDLNKFSEMSQSFKSKIFEVSGITNESIDLIKNFRSRSTLERLAELRRSVNEKPGLGGLSTEDDLNQWIITNMSKFVSKESPTNIDNLFGATPRLQSAINRYGLLENSVGPYIAQQSLGNWTTFIKEIIKNRRNPGSVPANELSDWIDHLLPNLGKYAQNKNSFSIFSRLTGSKHPYDYGFSDTLMAQGGYVNPSYSSNMSMPSYKTGVKYLYDDTIAQLHKGEAVIPENMNPWNPNSNSSIGGTTYYIQPTINAAPGMDENALANLTAQKVHNIFKEKEVKAGRNRVYSGGGTI